MLVLTRRPGEMVRLYTSDGVIEIYLNDCNQYQARIGFIAPDNVDIVREEIDDLAPPSPQICPILDRC